MSDKLDGNVATPKKIATDSFLQILDSNVKMSNIKLYENKIVVIKYQYSRNLICLMYKYHNLVQLSKKHSTKKSFWVQRGILFQWETTLKYSAHAPTICEIYVSGYEVIKSYSFSFFPLIPFLSMLLILRFSSPFLSIPTWHKK